MNPQLQNILNRDAIIVQQVVELSNVIIGIDTANKYSIFGRNGENLGSAAEMSGGAGGFILRQLFNSSRAATVQIFDSQGQEVGQLQKPFRFFFSEMSAVEGNSTVGLCRRTALIFRNFKIAVGGVDTFAISSSLIVKTRRSVGRWD